jgi:PAS domain S-box-containing protein
VKKQLRILHVEDVPADVTMVNHELRKGGLHFRSKRVELKEAFLHELEHHPPDLILSDHGLPCFDGFTALAIAKAKCPDVPFIFVTNSLGEETAIETFEGGATDYILKDNLAKLAPAVERALRQAAERAELKQKERDLQQSEERFRTLVEGVKEYAIVMLDLQGRVTSWNAGAESLHGYRAEEVTGQHFSFFYTPEDVSQGRPERDLSQAKTDGRFEGESRRLHKNGRLFWANVVITVLRDTAGKVTGFSQITRNITERFETQQALQKSEERYRRLVEWCPDALMVVGANGAITFGNTAAATLLRAQLPEELQRKSIQDILSPEKRQETLSQLRQAKEHLSITPFFLSELIRLDGTRAAVEMSAAPFVSGENISGQIIARDMTPRRQAEEALRKSEALKRAILETALDAILSISEEGLIQEWNPAAERIFGYSREETIGRPMEELIIPASLREVYQDGLTEYLMTGVGSLLGRPIELNLRRADGREFRAELAITRIPTEERSRCTALIRDITERKQAEAALRESEQRFRMLVEGVKDYAIYMLDQRGHVATWNSGAETIEGYGAEEIIGQHFSRIFLPEDVQQGKPERLLAKAAAEGRAVDEGWRMRKGGRRYWTMMTLTALRDEAGRLYGFSKISRDVTERKEAEEEIRRLNTDLEARVRQRTAQLQAANEELEAFSYSVSHDLRSPLRHIDGYVEMLKSELGPGLSEESQRYMTAIAEATEHLTELIEALLAFSRMGRAEMRQERIALADLVGEARRELRSELQGRQVEWTIGMLPEVAGDPFMLRQTMVNLLSNALKYTRTRPIARIDIDAEVTPHETIVAVRDNGVGFDMQYAHKLFGVFQRLHRASEFEGTGIGLANVRRVIHRHGGRTWAESVPNQGATFYFSLPHLTGDPS